MEKELDLTPHNLLLTAKEVGEFILARLTGGAYSELNDLRSTLSDELNDTAAQTTN